MSVFPSTDYQHNKDDLNIIAHMEKFYTDTISVNQALWSEAEIDARFEAGDQELIDVMYGSISSRSKFSFNRIRRMVNMVSGYQRKNRKSIIAVPMENGDADTADEYTKIMMWCAQREGILETVSDSFHDALITGISMLHVWLDYRTDPVSGDIKVDHCSYNSFLIDPYFRKQDLSDCNAIWKRSFLTKDAIMSLLPDSADEINDLPNTSGDDTKFQFMPENFSAKTSNDLMTYDEFYYRTYRDQKIIIDNNTGESTEWNGGAQELKDYLYFYPEVSAVDHKIPTVNLAIVVQGKVFYNDRNPLNIDIYPFVPVIAYHNPNIGEYKNRIQGIVRNLRDAQYLYNRRKQIELDIFESQVNSGFKYKENAPVDNSHMFMTGQGIGIAIKADAQMSDVEQIMPPQIPPSMFQLSEQFSREIVDISGINEELLGSAVDDKAGVLAMLRQSAGITTLQVLFDHVDYSLHLLGKLKQQIIQNNFTVGKIARILGKDPSPHFHSKQFGVYDVAIEEGFNTTTQRQLQFAQLLHLREAGIPIPDDVLIDAATIQNKSDIIRSIQSQQQQQQQQQQEQQQIAMQEQQARIRMAEAQAMADQGLGLERVSRIQENQAMVGERHAEAQKDRDQALLNMVKALKEIETIDLQNMEKVLALAQIVKQKEVEGAREQQAKQQQFNALLQQYTAAQGNMNQ